MPKPSTVCITINCGKFWKRWEYQTTWPASWPAYIFLRRQVRWYDIPISWRIFHSLLWYTQSLSHVQLFGAPQTVVHQTPLYMGFSRQEYWSGLPCPPSGDLPKPEVEPRSLALQTDSLPSETPPVSQFSGSFISDSLQHHGLQHTKLPCPLLGKTEGRMRRGLQRWSHKASPLYNLPVHDMPYEGSRGFLPCFTTAL